MKTIQELTWVITLTNIKIGVCAVASTTLLHLYSPSGNIDHQFLAGCLIGALLNLRKIREIIAVLEKKYRRLKQQGKE